MTALKNVDSVFAFVAVVSLIVKYYVKVRTSKAKGMTSALVSVIAAMLWLLFVRLNSDIYIGLVNNAVTLALFFYSTMIWRVWLHDFGISLRTGFREL
jgi:hypothetical protein